MLGAAEQFDQRVIRSFFLEQAAGKAKF